VVDHVLFRWHGIRVIDADGLTHLLGRMEDLTKASGATILTPHSGELARLLGCSSAEIEADRFAAVRRAVACTGAIVVLKGAYSLVGFSDRILVNTSGNPALATAGSGDVLTGIIAALACTLPPEQAAAAGVYLHGAAAEAWSQQHNHADRGLLASEIATYLPQLFSNC
jgi:ADP-dependent NAD(P)H-hydrate dehydratase / NAD(P)H-hydrate epimerase